MVFRITLLHKIFNMENKLQELTEKIYQEGVEKGSEEASRIVSEAKNEAGKLVTKAQEEAEAIISKAQNEAEDLKKSVQAELKLSYDQSLSALKQDVTSLVTDAIVKNATDSSFKDKAFFNDFLLTLAKTWGENQELLLAIPEKDEKGITDYLTKNVSDLLNKGITIEKVAGVKTGFQIGPADGSYKVSFTDADFESFFKSLLRPRIINLLFD